MVARDKAEDLCLALNSNITIELILMFMPVDCIDDGFMRTNLYPMKEFSYFQLIDYGNVDGVFTMILSYREYSEVVIERHGNQWRVTD